MTIIKQKSKRQQRNEGIAIVVFAVAVIAAVVGVDVFGVDIWDLLD